jgi:type I restriction enzyme R subunit/putative DNA methylase
VIPPAKLYEKPENGNPLAYARGSDPSRDRQGAVAFDRFFDPVPVLQRRSALFVTWRLHGSLPRVPAPIEYLTPGSSFTRIDRELEQAATGPRHLLDERVAQCVVNALQYGEKELHLYELHAWVLMVNHVHILIYPEAPLSKITKSIKNFSARQANNILGLTGQPFWQDESYDHWVRGAEELERIVRYIEENPVSAGLVDKVQDWRWSSGQAGRPVLH